MITFENDNCPDELKAGLQLIRSWQARDEEELKCHFHRHDLKGAQIDIKDGEAVITYHQANDAFRALGTLMSRDMRTGQQTEVPLFTRAGVMVDASRNAVPTVEWLKNWFIRLSLLGYDHVLLYLEDTYELPDEPYFGYMRGRYTEEELKTLDDIASSLGIELIGCIQTLGHLEQILTWSDYHGIKDSDRELRTDRPESYQLIEKMLLHFSSCLKSRTIHIGMDETQQLGTGQRLKASGYEPQENLFLEHLEVVCQMCDRIGLQPMMWNDMLFCLNHPEGQYYDPTLKLSKSTVDRFPRNAKMVYWDYYHDDPHLYKTMLSHCREAGFEPVMASGVWTWNRMSYCPSTTLKVAKACIDASRELGIRQLFFTLWGDDGAYCEWDSADVGLAQTMALIRGEDPMGESTQKRCRHLLRLDLAATCLRGRINAPDTVVYINEFKNFELEVQALLWDDPILGIYRNQVQLASPHLLAKNRAAFSNLIHQLETQDNVMDIVAQEHIRALAQYLMLKIELGWVIDQSASQQEVLSSAQRCCAQLDIVIASFRKIWNRRNKPHGFEILQTRLGGQRLRLEEVALRCNTLGNHFDRFPELHDRPSNPLQSLRTTHHVIHSGCHGK